ncbi:DNA polymerase III subunit alpha [Raoultella terrigena]|uniref:DNA polymerase III subunit alpha n=1 Tax=Raoultella terrigena TaxID=577 RepID=A0A4U9DCY8_RAOTE|nr:DNA polymerase III subunit alpha [Raoultella terrigena]
MLEKLIMSGAFDRLGPHRAALMNSLGDALKAADQHAKAEAIGQADMFGVLAEEPEQIEQSYAETASRGRSRWCSMGERETLGLYLTGHPINQYLKEIERYVGRRQGSKTCIRPIVVKLPRRRGSLLLRG